MSGRQKARVLPEPVKAIPIKSRPEKLRNWQRVLRDEMRALRSWNALHLDRSRTNNTFFLEEFQDGLRNLHILVPFMKI